MEFNQQNYPAIKAAYLARQHVEFEIPIDATAFAGGSAPANWTAYPPCILPPEDYARLLVYAENDAKGRLTALEIIVHLYGGRVLYKDMGSGGVGVMVTWPAAQ